MRHRTVEEGHTVEKMDTVDSLTRKLISCFEHLEDYLLLEQLAVPEDLWDPEGSVELWVASTGTYSAEEEIVVRGHLSLPTSVAVERDAEELAQLFKEELLGSGHFRHASTVAGVAGKAADERGVPSAKEAQLN
jgi:hypothetical protein